MTRDYTGIRDIPSSHPSKLRLTMLSSKCIFWLYVFTALIPLCFSSSIINQKISQYQILPTLREQALLQQTWINTRLAHIPAILKKHNVEVYLISQLEHGEDTVFWSLKSPLVFAARRRTVQLFIADPKPGLEESYTWIDNTPAVWSELNDVLEKQDPGGIVVNIDGSIAFSGGLRVGEMEQMNTWLPKKWTQMFMNVPIIGLEIVATMPKEQLGWYRKMMETAWAMITDGFSERVIVPGKTSTEDVEWWLRSQIQAYNYTTWFHPDVEIVGKGDFLLDEPSIINYGDMLHVDFGVTALGMNTDTQHLAYVLYPGETEKDIPEGLREGLKKANRMQDILKSNMKIGLSGNEILENSLKQMDNEGIVGQIYSHPIGDWGHSAGTLIGMFNMQNGVPIIGDYPLLDNTYYSVELYAEHFVPEKNLTMNFYQEEDIFWNIETKDWEWVYGRQEEFHVIKTEVRRDDVFQIQ